MKRADLLDSHTVMFPCLFWLQKFQGNFCFKEGRM